MGHCVQIDESLVTKRKYNVGRVVRQQWVIGMYDVNQKRGFISYIPNKSAVTLQNIIVNHVRRGTEIWTDQWRGYSNLRHLGYNHLTVNHKKNFRDPITGVCTNHVESYWSRFKQYLRRLGVTSSPFLSEYIDQYMWKCVYGETANSRMLSLTQHIAEKY